MDITNGTDDAVTVVGASSDACSMVQIHETALSADGVMSMSPLPAGLLIPAGGTVALEPGGVHLMCMQPSGSDEFEVILELDGESAITVPVTVEER